MRWEEGGYSRGVVRLGLSEEVISGPRAEGKQGVQPLEELAECSWRRKQHVQRP